MYRTLLSLIIIVDLVITSPVHVETTSQATHQKKHVSIKTVKTYLNKTRFGAKDLVNEFQDVIANSTSDADIDHHRHVAKGYLPKAIQTIIAMKESAESILRRIDENGLESPQVLGGKRDCHQLKKLIDSFKEVPIENLCSKLNRQEIIAYFKSDLNCLLGSIFELWRATERDGSYLTLGYREIIQTIKNLLEAIEIGTKRFAEEIDEMDFSKECSKFVHPNPVVVQRQTQPESKVIGDEGKNEEKDKAKDQGKGVNENAVVVSGVVNTGEASLVDKVERVLNLEKKELDEIKAMAEKEIENVGGAKNISVGLSGILNTQNTDEKKEEEKEDKSEVNEDGEGKDEEDAYEKKVKEVEEKEAETGKRVKMQGEEVEEEKNVTKNEKKEEEDDAKEKKEEAKEKSEQTEVEKVESKEKNVTEHTAVVDDNGTSDNRTSELADNIDKKLKGILKNEENNLNVILQKLDENNETTVKKMDKVEEEKNEIKQMLEEVETVKDNLDKIEAVKKNKSIETDDEEHKDSNVTIIDVIKKSPVLAAKLIPRIGIIIPTNESTNVTVKTAIPSINLRPTEVPRKVYTTLETNVKDLENEEKSLEVLRTLGQDTLPAANVTQPKLNRKDEKPKANVVPEAVVTGGVNDIDAQEEKDEEERAKEMVEKAKEEEEKEQEKTKQVMEPEIKTNVTNVKDEKEEERKEQKKKTITDSKPVEKMAATTSTPPPVLTESKNNTLDDLISRINAEEVQVRNLIKKLHG